jgi:ubiquinone biosynthesis protein Coq4
MSITLRQGLDRYYQCNPNLNQNQAMQIGYLHIPWMDLYRHDTLHVVTGYNTDLDQEMRLLGFLLTAVTWRRPWYYYLQSFGVFLETLGLAIRGKSLGPVYYSPQKIWTNYFQGVQQGRSVKLKINAYLDPETMLDRPLTELRQRYGIENHGAWD